MADRPKRNLKNKDTIPVEVLPKPQEGARKYSTGKRRATVATSELEKAVKKEIAPQVND